MTARQTGRPESTRTPVPMAETGGGPRPDPTAYAPAARSDECRATRSDDERRATANRTADRTPT